MAYSVRSYGMMMQDAVRMNAYAAALRSIVKSGHVVVDIGTGSGIHALMACRLGARKVYAIEPSNIIEVAREAAAANGFSGRIEFYQDYSTRVKLGEQADVVVSDMRGVLPLFEKHVPSIADARRRFLKPGGRLIPERDEIRVAVVEAADLFTGRTAPWGEQVYGFDMRAGRRPAVNTWMKAHLKPEQLLTDPALWARIVYTEIEKPGVEGTLRWEALRAGAGHGLLAWFDATLVEEVGFSNAPGAPEAVYGQAFFPWQEPVAIEAGDAIEAGMRADLIGGDYVWTWSTRVTRGGSSPEVRAAFRQSTFFGEPFCPARIRKRDSQHVPARNDEAEIDRFILERMDGNARLGEIAAQLVEAFPAHFSSVREALTHAGELSVRYSK